MRHQCDVNVDGDWISVETDDSGLVPVNAVRRAAKLPASRPLTVATPQGEARILNPDDYVNPNSFLGSTPTGIRG